MPSNDFKIKNLKAVDYKQAEIIDVSIKRPYGRRFKIKLADDSLSKEYRLNDIFKKVKKLSKEDSDPFKKMKI